MQRCYATAGWGQRAGGVWEAGILGGGEEQRGSELHVTGLEYEGSCELRQGLPRSLGLGRS